MKPLLQVGGSSRTPRDSVGFWVRLRGCRVASWLSPQISGYTCNMDIYIYIYVEKDLVSVYWHLGLSS